MKNKAKNWGTVEFFLNFNDLITFNTSNYEEDSVFCTIYHAIL